MSKLSPGARSWILITVFVVILLLVILFCEDARPNQIDTLELQLQWAFPLHRISDMKLVDFDQDGSSEILVCFQSDTSQIGIISVSDQGVIWHNSGLHGDVSSVAAGDRNSSGEDVCSGVYLYRLMTGKLTKTRKMVLLR